MSHSKHNRSLPRRIYTGSGIVITENKQNNIYMKHEKKKQTENLALAKTNINAKPWLSGLLRHPHGNAVG